jgi:spore germination protein KC/spore germination protein
MIRRIVLLPVLISLAALLPGCWDRTELNDLAFGISSAVDLNPDGSYRVSYMFPLPGQMGGASGGGGGTSGGANSYYIDSESGPTIRDASGKLQKRMSRRLFLSHRRTMLIGEELAKQGIEPLFDSMPRLPESRLSTFVVVTKGPAYKLLNAKPKFERFPVEAIREIAKSKQSMKINAKEMALALSLGSDPIALYMGEKSSEKADNASREITILGYAQFQEGRMVGVFSDDEARGLMWLRQSVQTHALTVTNPSDKQPVTAEIVNGTTHIHPKLNGDQVSFTVDIEASAKVRENFSKLDMNEAKDIQVVERLISDSIKKNVQLAIAKMQKNGTDSAQYGPIVWRTFPDAWQTKLEPKWRDVWSQAEFTVTAETSITEVGLINQNVIRRSY